MYIRKTTRFYNGKTYTNHLLVESVQTPQGPRQRTICSLGSLEPAPAEHWRALAHKLNSALQGQQSLPPVDSEIQPLRAKAIPQAQKMARASAIIVEPDRIQMEEGRWPGACGPPDMESTGDERHLAAGRTVPACLHVE